MIVNQPHDEQLGIQLIKAIESNQFNQLTIMVAYAKLTYNGEDAPIHVANANTVVLFRPDDLVIKYVDETVEEV